MGVARIKSAGKLKSVVTRDAAGAVLSEFRPHSIGNPQLAILNPAHPQSAILNPPTPLPEPTWDELIGHAGTALLKWASAGFPIAPPGIRAARHAICIQCSYWKETARFGAGKCSHPKCGCTKVKFQFATERCPDTPPKWGAWSAAPDRSPANTVAEV
jgi:hypothetical protein